MLQQHLRRKEISSFWRFFNRKTGNLTVEATRIIWENTWSISWVKFIPWPGYLNTQSDTAVTHLGMTSQLRNCLIRLHHGCVCWGGAVCRKTLPTMRGSTFWMSFSELYKKAVTWILLLRPWPSTVMGCRRLWATTNPFLPPSCFWPKHFYHGHRKETRVPAMIALFLGFYFLKMTLCMKYPE